MMSMSGGRGAIASALVYAAAAVLIGRRVLAMLASGIAGDVGDPVLNAGILAWNARTIPWTDAWYNFPGFHPARDGLTFSEHLLGVSAVATPLSWMTGNAAVTYNLTILATYVLCGLAMYALVWRLTRNAAASSLAGLAYAFAPYRAWQVVHVQAMATFWAPLSLLGLHAFVETGRRRWLALFGVCWMLQGAANGYFLVFFSVLVGLWVLWFVVARRRWRQLAMIAGAAVVALLPLVPILLRFVSAHANHGLRRPYEDILNGSADVTAVLCAPPQISAWRWLNAGVCGDERQLFPGAALVLSIVVGAVMARRQRNPGEHGSRIAGFYAVAALVTWAFTWGPAPRLNGAPVLSPGPYALLMLVPGVTELRVPARFWAMTVLCLCVVAGTLLPALLRRVPRAAPALVVALACAILVDGFGTIAAAPLLPSPPRPDLLRGGTVMTLPLGDNLDVDAQAQFDAVVGGWRSVNGYSGYEPRHYALLRMAAAQPEPALLAPFRARGDLHVIVVERSDRHNGFMSDRMPGARLVASGNGLLQFFVPGIVPPPRPARPISATSSGFGTPLELTEITASCSADKLPLLRDGDARTRWECGPQQPGQEIVADLGAQVPVGSVVQEMGEFGRDFPRQLRVETSTDREVWELVWEGSTWAQALEALLTEPTRARIVIPFAPRLARFVRLRLTGGDDVSYWSVAELDVWRAQ